MNLVTSAAGHYIDDSAEHAAKLRLIIVRLHFELLDRVNNGRDTVDTGSQLSVNHAVQ